MKVAILGAPVDLGADRRGVDMGPSAIRYADLELHLRDNGHVVQDFGNVAMPVPESEEIHPTHMKYLRPIVDMAQSLSALVAERVHEGWFPLVLGGDHSVSLGSVAGTTRARSAGIIWVDAHGDFNTADSSPSGNIHGMVLAALAGQGDQTLVDVGYPGAKVDTRNVVLIGVRSLDAGERTLLKQCGIKVFTMHDVDRLGLPQVVAEAAEIAGHGVDGIHLSLDLDVVDPMQAPGVGTPVFGGLTFRETHLAMELLAETRQLISMDVVEVNPILDSHNETARLAVEFTLSAMGKRILWEKVNPHFHSTREGGTIAGDALFVFGRARDRCTLRRRRLEEDLESDSFGFEVLASLLRADAGDLMAFMEALATKLEGALPSQTTVTRRGGGLFSGPKRVDRISVDLSDNRYELQTSGSRVQPSRSKAVRGIVLKTEHIPLDEWIDELSRQLTAEAQRSEQARLALERLLGV